MPEPTAEWQALIADLERQLSNKVRLRERLKSKLTLAEPGEQARLEIQIENLEEEIRGLKGELDELRQPGPGVVITRVRPLPDAPFLVPFVHNPDFVGRDEDLTLLHNMIAAGGSPVGIRPTGLVGLGGIVAIEYNFAGPCFTVISACATSTLVGSACSACSKCHSAAASPRSSPSRRPSR